MERCMDAIHAARGPIAADEGFSIGNGSLDNRTRDAQGWRRYCRCGLQSSSDLNKLIMECLRSGWRPCFHWKSFKDTPQNLRLLPGLNAT
jgi:hypothetical protein